MLTTRDDPDAGGPRPKDKEVQRVWQVLSDLKGRARPDLPAGLLLHQVVAATGWPRARVKRALAWLVEEGLCARVGRRYHVCGQGAEGGLWTGQTAVRFASGPSRGRSVCVGRLRVHPAGYGFVQQEGAEDVFVAARHRGGALDGDWVQVETWRGARGIEGRVQAVLERGRLRVSGVLERIGRQVVLVPDDPRVQPAPVQLPLGAGGARVGQAVVADIIRYPGHADEPLQAQVVSSLGEPGRAATEIAKILLCNQVPCEFPPEVQRAAEQLPSEVREVDLCDRLDLRDRPFVTIDPEDARDFDDAICVEPGPEPGLTRLWVAVADVSHYVPAGSALDAEAQRRGCSVYLPDRVVPMLPLPLSAGICSLHPGVDRLALAVALDLDADGTVQGSQLGAAVIRSRARLDYAGVAAVLRGETGGPLARYREQLPQLHLLRETAARLRARRLERGALDLELPEARVLLDPQDPERVVDVVRARQDPAVREAYRLVEDCMLAANEAVARFFASRGLPTIYRVHDVPTPERLLAFAALAEGCGLSFDAQQARSPRYLGRFLAHLSGRPQQQALSYLLLRSLQRARYDVVNVGHFGLAASAYLHFTSPIRRYPDLVAHRLLKHQLRREAAPAGGGGTPLGLEALGQVAAHSSAAERRAMEVEREVVDLYRALLMRDQVGQDHDGTIVGVTAFGLFVALDSPYVEGMIRTEQLGTDLHFDPRRLALSSRSGRRLALGDRVRVRIAGVSVAQRQVDLWLRPTPRRKTPRAPAVPPL
ncbi:MAG: VacB/RNase II family 3'-5' exoribonuclease [Myxococcales bacterium]|nr:VacB/RNase II family 3'-5' exoribonuclease [Myxococcota bacterium]MDW8281630.1 VacB/RNase II family 3'-5' exoribonuclease [Myxococcales bacterium]